jgi:hypothetical protein
VRHLLKRILFGALAVLIVGLAITIPMDAGDYDKTFRQHGLIGILSLPSILFAQVWFFLSAALFMPISVLRARAGGRPRLAGRLCVLTSIMGIASCTYLAAILGLVGVSGSDMFGWGTAGLLVIFVWAPSLLILGLGALGALGLALLADWGSGGGLQ